MSETTKTFTFHFIDPSKQQEPLFKAFAKREVQEKLAQWDLVRTAQLLKLRFDEAFLDRDIKNFVDCLLRSPEFTSNYAMITRQGSSAFVPPASTADSAQQQQDETTGTTKAPKQQYIIDKLNSTVTDMSFFDKLFEAGLVNPSTKSLQKTFDQYIQEEQITTSDKFRELMAASILDADNMGHVLESENLDVFSREERAEFIFHLMARLAIGGGLNQYEDTLESYLETTKLLYKDLICVQRNAETGEPQVASKCYILRDRDQVLFYRDSSFNFFYVIIDPIRRHVNVWTFTLVPML